MRIHMSNLLARAGAVVLAIGCMGGAIAMETAPPSVSEGVVTVPSAYSLAETVDRLKQAVSEKGIMYFATIDQAKLGAGRRGGGAATAHPTHSAARRCRA